MSNAAPVPQAPQNSDHRRLEIVREHERRQITSLSRAQWWREEREGRAARRVQLGPNSVGWIRGELEDWVRSRIEQRDSMPIGVSLVPAVCKPKRGRPRKIRPPEAAQSPASERAPAE
jgi:predicted DNA-binding transcriptional regulator AlpA